MLRYGDSMARIARLALPLSVAALLVTAVPASAAERRVPFGFFGTTVSSLLYDSRAVNDLLLDQQVGVMAANGVESMRLIIDWRAIEPRRRVYNFASIDRFVKTAALHNIRFLPNVTASPQWASQRPGTVEYWRSPPKSNADFAALMRQLVLRYGSNGSFWRENPTVRKLPIRQWQIWNEPTAPWYWSRQPFARSYTRLLKAAYRAIHRADRKAKVVVGPLVTARGDYPPWIALRDLYRAGAKRYYDVLSVHPFTNNPSSRVAVRQTVEVVRRMRREMRRRGDGRKPVILTEVTWPAAQGKVPAGAVNRLATTEAGQIARMREVLPPARAPPPDDADHRGVLVHLGLPVRQQHRPLHHAVPLHRAEPLLRRRVHPDAAAGGVRGSRGDLSGRSQDDGRPGLRQLNVLYVSHTGQVSGAELSLLDLLTSLPASVRPSLACPAEGPLAGLAADAGVRTLRIAGTAGSLKVSARRTSRAVAELGLAAAQLVRLAARARADVVHANSVRAGLAAVPASRLTRRPVVVHVRDRLPRGRLADAALRITARGGTVLLANSRFTADGVTAVAPGADLRIVHNAVDLARFDPARQDREQARAALGVADGDAFVAGVVGQITPWKGQLEAVQAVALLAERHPSLRLVVAGEPKFVDAATRFDNRAYVEELRSTIAQRGLEDRVTLLGERGDVPAVLAALDALLVPSWAEPFGRVVLEGMAMGVPVLATGVGGPAEIITDGRDGLLLPPATPAVWAGALERLMAGRREREALGRAGRERAAEFTADRHVTAVLAAYEAPPVRQPA